MPLSPSSPAGEATDHSHAVQIGPRLDALMKRRSLDPKNGPDPAVFLDWLRAGLMGLQMLNEDAAKSGGSPLDKSAYEGILRSFLAVNVRSALHF